MKTVLVMILSLLAISVSAPLFAQDPGTENAAKKASVGKEARLSGIVAGINLEKSMLKIRPAMANAQNTVYYDSSTRWTSSEHGSKTVHDITPNDVKTNDRVICLGWYDDKSVFHAALISKRLTPR